MYSDDHAPPHFHVQTRDGESLVQIGKRGRIYLLYGPHSVVFYS
ncbi:DUF4160 domain-containing protein [Pseudomonas salmasensis]